MLYQSSSRRSSGCSNGHGRCYIRGTMIKNAFFKLAVGKAAKMAGKPGRLIMLLSNLALKLRGVNWKALKKEDAKEKFFILGRLIKAYAQGQYKSIPWKTFLIIVAAVIYFINPLDFVPDLIPIAGLADDFAVLLWVYNAVGGEVEKFLLWERTQLPA
jgi:uncharacterized membrane protein YkvA (DUF1232 family)